MIGEVVANSGASRVDGAFAVRGLPHSAQNLAFGRFALPQKGQRASSAAPQAMQNLPVSGVSEWQFGHSMSAPYPTSRVYCFRVIVARQARTEMRLPHSSVSQHGPCFIGQLGFDLHLRGIRGQDLCVAGCRLGVMSQMLTSARSIARSKG